jgi:leader peptidase (prepilin peptidase)/N-methyltransferase
MDYFLVTLLGLVFGSFTTMMIHRIPREIPLGLFSHHWSQCPNCGKRIPFSLNLPVLGYFLAKGRCAACRKKISVRYPIVEFITGALFLLTYEISLRSVMRPPEELAFYLELTKNLGFVVALVATVFIDFDFRIIPDRFSIGCWVVAVLGSLFWGTPPIVHSVMGGLMGFGIFFLMSWGYEKLKGIEGLGFGDVKMMGWLGSWLGIFAVPLVILIASLTGLLAGILAMRKGKEGLKTAIPFGPFLALGAYFVWIMMNLGIWNFDTLSG